jgi:hypothetical protein
MRRKVSPLPLPKLVSISASPIHLSFGSSKDNNLVHQQKLPNTNSSSKNNQESVTASSLIVSDMFEFKPYLPQSVQYNWNLGEFRDSIIPEEDLVYNGQNVPTHPKPLGTSFTEEEIMGWSIEDRAISSNFASREHSVAPCESVKAKRRSGSHRTTTEKSSLKSCPIPIPRKTS